jgi:hypothetical protein
MAIARPVPATIATPATIRLPSILWYLSCSVLSLIFHLLKKKKMLSLATGQGEHVTEKSGFGSITRFGISGA